MFARSNTPDAMPSVRRLAVTSGCTNARAQSTPNVFTANTALPRPSSSAGGRSLSPVLEPPSHIEQITAASKQRAALSNATSERDPTLFELKRAAQASTIQAASHVEGRANKLQPHGAAPCSDASRERLDAPPSTALPIDATLSIPPCASTHDLCVMARRARCLRSSPLLLGTRSDRHVRSEFNIA